MKTKAFCILLGVLILVACENHKEDFIEPEQPPIEQPEEPKQPEQPTKRDTIDVKDIINIKIDDKTMAIIGSNSWNGIAYGNGKYVAVGDSGYTAYSTDGVNWTQKQIVNFTSLNKIAFGNGKFVAVGKGTEIGSTNTYYGNIIYSSDGINWERVTLTNQYL